ncbi:hypothetical protein KI809_01085 [Geobacter pelophilus]|uniref:Uncharacterized protein n=2 Tax=Geoanaerobacter pelophilus TaxID=60036 RepID=A0AAW4KWD9_9BACT|nr:hypothetical protein [Geoanaerobacter pelophilus]
MHDKGTAMTCLCPKCGASIEMDHTGIPSEGLKTACPVCKARLQIVRESFARMAYGSSSGKSCASCGGQLGTGLNCTVCGVLYPDFFMAADPAVIKRHARELKRQQMLAVFKDVEFSLPSFKGSGAGKPKLAYSAKAVVKGSRAASGMSRSLPALIGVIVLIVAVFGGGYVMYTKNKAEKMYVETYFKALYGIKTGNDLSTKVISRIATEWKSAQDSGRSFAPFPSAEDLTKLNKVKSEVEKIIAKQLADPPDKFAASREGLVKLNGQYGRLHALASTPPNSLPELNDAFGKASASFAESAKSLKSTLPEVMTAELENAKKKYKNLREF